MPGKDANTLHYEMRGVADALIAFGEARRNGRENVRLRWATTRMAGGFLLTLTVAYV